MNQIELGLLFHDGVDPTRKPVIRTVLELVSGEAGVTFPDHVSVILVIFNFSLPCTS
jgi:hypothetical protein